MRPANGRALAALLLVALAASGCGLKGALTMPSKSDEVVIRKPGATTPATGETTATPPSANPTAPTGPTEEGATRKPPRDDRIPPPPLPGGNPGTARGG
jgi:hypothetical protein